MTSRDSGGGGGTTAPKQRLFDATTGELVVAARSRKAHNGAHGHGNSNGGGDDEFPVLQRAAPPQPTILLKSRTTTTDYTSVENGMVKQQQQPQVVVLTNNSSSSTSNSPVLSSKLNTLATADRSSSRMVQPAKMGAKEPILQQQLYQPPPLQQQQQQQLNVAAIAIQKPKEPPASTNKVAYMKSSVKLLDESLQWVQADGSGGGGELADYLLEQSDYLVVGVLGKRGVGKSTLMSLLAGVSADSCMHLFNFFLSSFLTFCCLSHINTCVVK